MSPVFGHGDLRLYLLSLLAEQPRHGYELISALRDRFGGTYAPSAGTVYPRLAKLEDDGLVTKTSDGRKSVYAATDAGKAEVASRADDLAAIESEVSDSVRRLANEVRIGVGSAMKGLRAELASAAREPAPAGATGGPAAGGDGEAAGRDAARRADLVLAGFRQRARSALRAGGDDAGVDPAAVDRLEAELDAVLERLR